MTLPRDFYLDRGLNLLDQVTLKQIYIV
jgi:hypothetical protein